MVATRCVSQRLEQDVRAEEEAELYRLESGASAEDLEVLRTTWNLSRIRVSFHGSRQ